MPKLGERTLRLRRLAAAEQVRHRQHEALAGPERVEIGAEEPGGQRDDEAHEDEKADVGPEQVARRDRSGMGRQEGMHHREGPGAGEGVGDDRAAEAARDAEDDREHHDEARIEEDREAEEQRGDAEGEGRAVIAEDIDEAVGEHLRAAGHLEDAPDHRAEADEQGDGGERGAEALEQGRHDIGKGYAGDERGEQAHQHQRHEGVDAKAQDEREEQEHGSHGDNKQRSRPVGWLDGFHGVPPIICGGKVACPPSNQGRS